MIGYNDFVKRVYHKRVKRECKKTGPCGTKTHKFICRPNPPFLPEAHPTTLQTGVFNELDENYQIEEVDLSIWLFIAIPSPM